MKMIKSLDFFTEQGGFPLRVMRISDHGSTHGLHGHEFYEFVIVLSGQGLHHTESGAYAIASGDVFLLRENMAHGYANTHNLSLINILFDPTALRLDWHGLYDLPGYHALFRIEPKLRREDHFSNRLQLAEDQLARALEIIAHIEAEMAQATGGYRFIAVGYLMQLITFLSRCYAEMEQPRDQAVIRLGHVLTFIEQHYNETISIARLAKVAHMSETSLIRAFNKVLNRPPMDHVIRTRVSKARALLQRTDLSITEIAFACGFNDSNYFSRQFRKITNQSPRAFRAAHA